MSRTAGLLLCLLPGVGYLLAFFGLPLARVVAGSFAGSGPDASSFTLAAWTDLLTNPVYLDGLWFSLWLGIAPTIVSLVSRSSCPVSSPRSSSSSCSIAAAWFRAC
jgi:putative spermidine/putrescine transport system permease protein